MFYSSFFSAIFSIMKTDTVFFLMRFHSTIAPDKDKES